MKIPKGPYDPLKTEPEILEFWLKGKFNKPEYHAKKGLQKDLSKDDRESFCIICPPPNANARPHLGNLSGYSYQDLMGRFSRMNGKTTLLFPGKDHAGIQAEVVFEREKLKPKGVNKIDLGREEFYKQCYEFTMECAKIARADEMRVGLSADFDRDLFTLDPKVVDIILETFLKLHKDKLVYKGIRITNWCTHCQTALADVDTEFKDATGNFVYMKYGFTKPDPFALELKNYFTGKSAEGTVDEGQSKERDYVYGHIKGLTNPYTKNKVQAIGIGFKKKLKKGEKLSGKAIGLQMRLDRDYAVIVMNPAFFEDVKNEVGKVFMSELKKVAGSHIILFDEYPEDKFYTDGFTLGTVRPETKFGDTAIAVNPKDDRYKDFVDKEYEVETLTGPKKISVLTDPFVDPEFGTGLIKVTPAHAPEDYDIMLRWNAEHPDKQITYRNIIGKDGTLTGPVGKYKGMTTHEARKVIIPELKERGILIHLVENYENRLRVCERCKNVVEPLISSQWYVDVDTLKIPAIEAVKKGKIKIHPKFMEKRYFNWLENLRDWPISRSLWWGYRFPVWYKGKHEEYINDDGQVIEMVGGKELDAHNTDQMRVQLTSPGKEWIQDEDVFDTWFSSGQWAYATLMTEGLMDKFYPTQVMETMYDILELWVTRMVMLGQYRVEDIPFKDVYLHGMLLASDGNKMSKSRGNVINMDDIVNEYGADTLRLFYYVAGKAGSSYRFDWERIKYNRNFLNKIWNAGKFVMMHLKKYDDIHKYKIGDLKLRKEDKDMLWHLNAVAKNLTKHINNFKFNLAIEELQDSFWNTFCGQYLEYSKDFVYDKENENIATRWVLWKSIKTYLELMHPFIPFITEKMWQMLPKDKNEPESVMYAQWPNATKGRK